MSEDMETFISVLGLIMACAALYIELTRKDRW